MTIPPVVVNNLPQLSASGAKVAIFLCKKMPHRKNYWRGAKLASSYIALKTGIGKRSVVRAIQNLVDQKVIEVQKFRKAYDQSEISHYWWYGHKPTGGAKLASSAFMTKVMALRAKYPVNDGAKLAHTLQEAPNPLAVSGAKA